MPTYVEAQHSSVDPPGAQPPESVVFGSSQAMQAIRQALQKVATSSASVLITGETGTGKEILAKQIHLLSPWRTSPLCKINCPILRGAQGENDPLYNTLSTQARLLHLDPAPGLPARTTLFLDEVALLDPALQVKLLERLQESPLLQVPLSDDLHLELRVISDTSRQLEQEVRAGSFLRELYYAVRVVSIELPPLRDRRGDIPQLTDYFLDYYNRKFQTHTPPPPPRIMRVMSEYDWPGNIRELENLIMRYVVQGSEGAFAGELGNRPSGRSFFPPSSQALPPMKEVARQAIQELERKIIRTVLEQHRWNRKESARALNISYRALLYKIKAAGIPPKRLTRAAQPPRPRLDVPRPPDNEKRGDTPA